VVSDITPVSGRHLIGRHASGSGDAQEVTVSGGLEFQGSGIRRAALTGDVTASAGSDSTTLANVGTAGTYRSVTTDAKGRVTAGTNPTTLDGYGITDAAAAVHTHVSDDITDASDDAIGGKIAKYTSSSGLFALGLELYNGTGNTKFQAEAGAENYTINVPAADGTLALTSDLAAKANIDSQTHTGAHAFSSTTRPTSSGTGTPEATSLITLADGDGRFGETRYAYKSSSTARSETTTYEADPDLSVLLSVGFWSVTIRLNLTAASDTPGSKVRLAGSGLAFTAAASLLTTYISTGVGSATSLATLHRPDTATLPSLPRVISGSNDRSRVVDLHFFMPVTTEGTLLVEWAQQTSSADSTSMRAGSHIIARKIA
jgi:hypothetical protein